MLASSLHVCFLCVNAHIASIVQMKKMATPFFTSSCSSRCILGERALMRWVFLGLLEVGEGPACVSFLAFSTSEISPRWANTDSLQQQTPRCTLTVYIYNQQQTLQCTLTVSNKHQHVHLQSAANTAVYTYSQQQTPQCTLTVSNRHCSVHLQSATNTAVYSYSQ